VTHASGAVSPTPPLLKTRTVRIREYAARAWRTCNELFDDRNLFDLIGVMTVLLVILHLDSIRGLREIIVIACGAGIVDRRLLHSPVYWFGLTMLLVTNHALLWDSLDNHKYLQTYWCLAIGVSRLSLVNPATLALNARWLIGLCFLFCDILEGLCAGIPGRIVLSFHPAD
jgi:hypothetical protein